MLPIMTVEMMMKTIRQSREERGWSQVTVAVRVGVAGRTVSNWERGLTRPSHDHQQHLATLFGVSVEGNAFRLTEQAPQEPHHHGLG